MAKIEEPIYIMSAARTPIGSYLGALSSLSAPELGSRAIEAALVRANAKPAQVGEVYFGNVLSAGIGQAPARQAALKAGLPHHVPCTTVGKVCGSGLQAVVLGAKSLLLGDADIVVAGGMEAMSRVPYYLDKARSGYRMGDGKLVDGMIFDGLWDPYNDFHMGRAGELCAEKYHCTREAQDAFATESYGRAMRAARDGSFQAELVPVVIPGPKGTSTEVTEDEEPGRGKPEKFGQLKPAFTPDGTITAANASSINDGAAALVLANARGKQQLDGQAPLATIVGYASAAQAPEWFTTAPALAIKSVLELLKLQPSDIDLWEINEAFSCVTMTCAELCGVPLDRVNVNGGAVALGHPIGATGARILTTLVHALTRHGKRRGLATLCIGGGEAVAVVVERP
jgi:acetyl-CoA C-acetyltransferase